jgi:CRISPR/Cas system-associated exonuclease Cas4 (RecB family)
VPPPERQSSYFALYGMLIEAFFKKYTNIFTKQGIDLTDEEVKKTMKGIWAYILEKNYVDWTEPWVRQSSEDIFQKAYEDALLNMKKFDFWANSRAEVSYEILLKKSDDLLTCRLDFIVNNPDGTIEVIDGKGTDKIDKNVDIEQLFYYALMYLLKNKRLPDKLGFLYYRYQLIRYIEFDMDSIMAFKDKLAIVKRTIKDSTEFEPKVALSKHCRWCAYRFQCDAYNAKKDENAAKRRGGVDIEYTGTIMDL